MEDRPGKGATNINPIGLKCSLGGKPVTEKRTRGFYSEAGDNLWWFLRKTQSIRKIKGKPSLLD